MYAMSTKHVYNYRGVQLTRGFHAQRIFGLGKNLYYREDRFWVWVTIRCTYFENNKQHWCFYTGMSCLFTLSYVLIITPQFLFSFYFVWGGGMSFN